MYTLPTVNFLLLNKQRATLIAILESVDKGDIPLSPDNTTNLNGLMSFLDAISDLQLEKKPTPKDKPIAKVLDTVTECGWTIGNVIGAAKKHYLKELSYSQAVEVLDKMGELLHRSECIKEANLILFISDYIEFQGEKCSEGNKFMQGKLS